MPSAIFIYREAWERGIGVTKAVEIKCPIVGGHRTANVNVRHDVRVRFGVERPSLVENWRMRVKNQQCGAVGIGAQLNEEIVPRRVVIRRHGIGAVINGRRECAHIRIAS